MKRLAASMPVFPEPVFPGPVMPASLSSFGNRSCKVENMRSERPRASGE